MRMLSLRQNKNSSFPGHAPGKDTLRAANAATERGLTGENARANVVSGRALSPVKIKIPVATADMRRHSDTLRGAQRRRKWGLTGEKTHERATRSEGVCSSVKKPRTRRRKWGSRGENRISVANSVVFPSQKVTLSRQPFRFLRIHRWHRSSASEQRRPLRERCTAFRPLRNR